jgi:uncharacterized protein with FMN-binding domain
MKKLWIGRGAITLVLMMAMLFAGCNNGGSSTGAVTVRTVNDGTFITRASGWHWNTPVEVITTFAGNAITRLAILSHAESPYVMDSVLAVLIPRIIQTQSLDVSAVSGATLTSIAILAAVEEAIELADGDVMDWLIPPPVDRRPVVLPADGKDPFDVIVVGLGGTGMMAYVSAAETLGSNGTVFGMEASGQHGGISIAGSGNFAIGSRISQHYPSFPSGAVHGVSDSVYEQFMNLFGLMFGGQAGNDPQSGVQYPDATLRHQVTHTVQHGGVSYILSGWEGGANMNVISAFFRNSGATLNWMMDNGWPWNGSPPGGGMRPAADGNPARVTTTTHSAPSGYFAPLRVAFHQNNMIKAERMNSRNNYRLNLRGVRILTDNGRPDGNITGVEAIHNDGRTFVIRGNTVILGTGGFIGNTQMMTDIFGTTLHKFALGSAQGDGIVMAARDVGAATFNLGASPSVHRFAFYHDVKYSVIPGITGETDGMWRGTLRSLLSRPQNIFIALGEAFDGVSDLRGQRFVSEASTFGGGGMGRSVGNSAMLAGGRWASIFSNDQLYRLENEPIRHQAMPSSQSGLGLGVPSNQSVTFLRPLLAWAEQTNNAVRIRATGTMTVEQALTELARQIGIPGHANTLRATLVEYNEVVKLAATFYNEDDILWLGSGASRRGLWPDYDPHIPGTGGDPLSVFFNCNHGLYNFSKPLYLAPAGGYPNDRRLWEQSITLCFDEQRANATEWGITDFTPGFTAILGRCEAFNTVGGLEIDGNIQVLRPDGTPIRGLYAGGADSLGNLQHRQRFYGDNSIALGWAHTSGRTAGRNAANEAISMR